MYVLGAGNQQVPRQDVLAFYRLKIVGGSNRKLGVPFAAEFGAGGCPAQPDLAAAGIDGLAGCEGICPGVAVPAACGRAHMAQLDGVAGRYRSHAGLISLTSVPRITLDC